MSKKNNVDNVVINQPKYFEVALEIEGEALIQNNFPQKVVEQMLRKHMGHAVQREAKKPREVLENALIKNVDNVVSVPPSGIKKAMLTAAMQVKGLKKTQLRTALFIVGNSIPVQFESMTARMDMVRTSGQARTPDFRFRPQLNNWRARLIIRFPDGLSVNTVVDLLNRAGTVGLCEWRPEKDGTFGTFVVSRAIDDLKEIEEVRKECAPRLKPLVIPEWALDADIDIAALRKIMGEQHTLDEGEGASELAGSAESAESAAE